MRKTLRRLLWMVTLSVAAPVLAGQYEVVSSQVQRMLTQAARNDEAGLNATRQQLENLAGPAHRNVKEARTLNQQGLDALKRNDYQAAATAFQKAQEADPADVEVAGNLGYANLKLGQFKRAEHQLVYAVSLAPGRSSSWYNLGQAYGALDTVDKATGAFAAAYRFSQNPPKTLDFMRQALTAPENNAATRTALKRALELFERPAEGSSAR